MKIKALFAGLLGCINVLLPLASQAADEAVSDKADWLKKSLAAVGETQEATVPALTIADLPSPARRKKQLRAFMANRPLPRKTDLSSVARLGQDDEDSLATQIPVGLSSSKMIVVEDKSPLAGQVSLNSTANAQRSENLALKAITTTLTHFNNARAQGKTLAKSTHMIVPEPPKAAVNKNVNALLSSLPNNVLDDVDIVGGKDSMTVSSKERQLIEKLNAEMATGDADVSDDNVETFSADSLSELKDQDAPVANSAGSAPFPLNLLPQQALKSLITGGKRTSMVTSPARFGSWHSLAQGQGTAGSVAGSMLPQAGFVSHMRRAAVSRAAGFATRYTHVAVSGTSARSLAGTVKQIAARQVDSLARYAPYTPARVYLF